MASDTFSAIASQKKVLKLNFKSTQVFGIFNVIEFALFFPLKLSDVSLILMVTEETHFGFNKTLKKIDTYIQ